MATQKKVIRQKNALVYWEARLLTVNERITFSDTKKEAELRKEDTEYIKSQIENLKSNLQGVY